jgi:CheY-like chemotaxis protein/nitrogen-specific signal transduction histidine kinase
MSRALAVFRDNAREIQIAKKQAEDARAEAEAASRAKSTFLANMSHELRTPLNAIIGYSEILAEDATDRGDAASVQDLAKIQAAGKHLLGLINSILDLSKIEAGRMDLYLEQVNLQQLIEEVRVIIQPMIENNGNRLVIEAAPDIGAMRTDLTKLKQSLLNLLSNAAKFTKQGEVGLAVARQAGPAGASHVLFTVSDSGIGMTQEQMGRLFEAFSQSDASTTRNYGGTGLGLAITRRFATMLGGSINVTSTPGVGSRFVLELPDQSVAVAARSSQVADERAEVDESALTVLVVDDDPAVHEVLTATLARRGYRVMHATDGAEALAIMRKTPPDIVTLDIMMPKVDGWTVLGTMKSDPALEHIPVIMLTIVDDRNLGYSLGASEYMTKPVDRERLLTLVRRFTSSNANAVVLIVDDDPEVRNVVRAALHKEGLRTAEAANGRAALDWMDANPVPDLVLLDLMMPEMDGFQFLERTREHPERLKIPVVVLTAKDLTAEEKAFLAERTILVLGKSAQPINSLGTALAAIAQRPRAGKSPASIAPATA